MRDGLLGTLAACIFERRALPATPVAGTASAVRGGSSKACAKPAPRSCHTPCHRRPKGPAFGMSPITAPKRSLNVVR